MNPKSQKEENRRFSAHYRKHNQAFCSPRSPRAPHSPRSLAFHRHHGSRNLGALTPNNSSHDPCHGTMPIPISSALRRWLMEKGFEGYIRVAKAPPHSDAQKITKKLNVDTVMNANIRKKLGLTALREKHSPCRRPRKIFRRILNLCQSLQNKGHSERFFPRGGEIFIGSRLRPCERLRDAEAKSWHRHRHVQVITGSGLREGLHAFQAGKKLCPNI